MAHAKNIGDPLMAHAKNLYNIPWDTTHTLVTLKIQTLEV